MHDYINTYRLNAPYQKRIVIVLLCVVTGLFPHMVWSQSSEYLVKAAFLERFTRFVE